MADQWSLINLRSTKISMHCKYEIRSWQITFKKYFPPFYRFFRIIALMSTMFWTQLSLKMPSCCRNRRLHIVGWYWLRDEQFVVMIKTSTAAAYYYILYSCSSSEVLISKHTSFCMWQIWKMDTTRQALINIAAG